MDVSLKTLFNANTPNLYTMPPSAPFLKQLAIGLNASLGDRLSTAMVLLPTRRAVRELADEFLKLRGRGAALLPLMRTLADMDENEPPFILGSTDIDMPPSIDSVRHVFELAQLITKKMTVSGQTPDAASAIAMSEPLVSLLSDLALEELGPDALIKLNDDLGFLPEHFQNAAEFVKIITQYWPKYLLELGLMQPSTRRVALLNAAAKIWNEAPPAHPVIIAGTTGTLAATTNLIKSVAKMKQGLVVLPGLDKHIDDKVWNNIDDQHAQTSLKNLIAALGLSRKDIQTWPEIKLPNKAQIRSRILSESLIPADQTADWPERISRVQASDSMQDSWEEGLEGLSLIEAKTEEEEASVIAIIMRETLETPDKTCALITPDPSLARRVRAKLSRWRINVDNSAGEPLEETLHGSFLTLSVQLAFDPFNPVALTSLVGHKLFSDDRFSSKTWGKFETLALRGPRQKSMPSIEKRLGKQCEDGLLVYKTVQTKLALLAALLKKGGSASAVATLHTQLVESLTKRSGQHIWRGEAGEKSAQVLEELIAYGGLLPTVSGQAYARLLSTMLRGRVVRPRYGTEERLQILGPLEARMLEADIFILGGLNEGVWPAPPAAHPILSRGMRIKIGLTAPERRFGLAAHDFAQLAAKPNVFLTRAQKTSDGPSVQSRWLWRLTTLAKGANKENALKTAQHYLHWARELDKAPDKPQPANPPAPRPPIDMRWPKERRMSVTQIQTWVRDPYAIYAKNILRLRSLDALDQPLGGREYGTAIHKALEKLDGQSEAKITELLAQELGAVGYEPHTFSRHNIRLKSMANWLIHWAKRRKDAGWKQVGIEKKGKLEIKTNGAPFTLSGIADRLEQRGTEFAIMDYKTGVCSSKKTVQSGFDPQLPLLAVMLSAGTLGKAGNANDLLYIKPNEKNETAREKSLLAKDYDAQKYEVEALSSLKKLIEHFDDAQSAYYSQPRSQFINPFGDYDQLARRSEWAKLGREGSSNE